MDLLEPTVIPFDYQKAVPYVTGIPLERFLTIYTWGSRFFGLATESSDYDFVGVVDDYCGNLSLDATLTAEQRHFSNVHEGQFEGIELDVAVYERNFWQSLLDKHIIWVVALHCSRPLKNEAKLHFELVLPKLKYEVLCDASKNSKLAKKYWKDGNIRKSKKRLVYILQHMQFAVQLASIGTVSNFQGGNHFHFELFGLDTINSWENLFDWSTPKHKTLMEEIQQLTNEYRNFKDSDQEIALITYLNRFGIQSITLKLGVYTTPIACQASNTQLYRLVYSENTPMDALVTRQCTGTIVGTDGKRYWLEALPYTKFGPVLVSKIFQFSDEMLGFGQKLETPTIRWKHGTSFPRYDSILALLFWDHTKWQVSIGHHHTLDQNNQTSMEKQFWELLSASHQLPDQYDKCFMFELNVIHPRRVVIVDPLINNIILCGVRDLKTFKEVPIQPYLDKYGWQGPTPFPELAKKSEHFIQNQLLKYSPFSVIGFVIIDDQLNRTTIYHPAYIFLRNVMQHGIEPGEQFDQDQVLFLARILRSDTDMEHLRQKITIPALVSLVEQTQQQIKKHSQGFDLTYLQLKCADAREFASKVKSLPPSMKPQQKVLFEMNRLNLTAFQYYQSDISLADHFVTKHLHESIFGVAQQVNNKDQID